MLGILKVNINKNRRIIIKNSIKLNTHKKSIKIIYFKKRNIYFMDEQCV